jgi:hypothetical protein
MTTRFTAILLILIVALGVLSAQEKPTPPGKPQPQPGIPVVSSPDTSLKSPASESPARSSQGLPKFDLPEYVITGVASLDLPEEEKQIGDEPLHELELANPAGASRDRLTFEFVAGEKESLPPGEHVISSGRIQASSGTYFTSRVGAWFNQFTPNNFILGDIQYGVSKAYVPFANRSGGRLNLSAGVSMRGTSEGSARGDLSGNLGYGSDTYRFYGSPTPSLTRTVSDLKLSAILDAPHESLFNYNVHAGFLVTSIGDSSSTIRETQLHIGGMSNLILGSVPIDGRIDFSLASYSGSGGGSLPYLDASLMTQRLWYGNFFLDASVHFYLAQGMLSQKFARVYPHIEAGYKVFENTIASASYLGRVQNNTLASLLQVQPYLSAISTIRQSELPLDLTLALETDWSNSWRTRFSARFQSVRDYPLLTEAGSPGIWTTAYGGTTSVATYQAEIFAKFDANSYFTMSLEINDSKNSVTTLEVPYLPDLRLSGGLSLEVARGLRLLPTIAFVNRRVPDLYVPSKLKEYADLGFRGEYSAFKSLTLFFDCRNLTDSKYEEWNGYRAVPLVVTGGIGYRW